MYIINLLCVNLAIFSPLTSYKAVDNHSKIAIIHFLLVAIVWVRNVPQRPMCWRLSCHLGTIGNFKRWGLIGGLLVYGDVPLKRGYWDSSSHFFFNSWPCSERLALTLIPCYVELPGYRPTGTEPREMDWNLWT